MPGFEGTHGNTVHEPMLLHNETQHVSLKMDMSQLKVCDHFPPESTFPIPFLFLCGVVAPFSSKPYTSPLPSSPLRPHRPTGEEQQAMGRRAGQEDHGYGL